MDYCPEIAILHGTFACLEAESKAGKYDLLHHTKGDKSSRPYLLIKDTLLEIIQGSVGPRSQQEQTKWSRRLHHLLFCKAFVFSQQWEGGDNGVDEHSKTVTSFKAWCRPVPDFHPYLFFELSDDLEWADFHGDLLAVLDLPPTLNFTARSLAFCDPDPALFTDLRLMSTTLDFLLSAVLSELAHTSQAPSGDRQNTDVPSQRSPLFPTVLMTQEKLEGWSKVCLEAAACRRQRQCVKMGGGGGGGGGEEEEGCMLDEEEEGLMSSVDEKRRREAADQQVLDKVLEQVDHHVQDRLTQLADLLTQTLTLVQRRMSTKLFDRDCCKSGSAMTAVLPVLGHILGSVVVLCVLSVSDVPGHQFRWCLDGWASMEEDEDPGLDVSCVSSSEKSSEAAVCNEDRSVSVIGEALSRLVRTSEVKSACLNCLTSFFTVQTTKKGGAATTATGGARGLLKLSDEKAVKFGRVLKLTLRLCRFPQHLKLVRVVRTFSELLQADESGEQKGDGGGGLRRCVSLMAGELQRREKAAEERRRNPSLAEVMEKVQRKAPRWEWYLEYGLAKRDLKNWWLAGFVEFLHARPWVLRTECDMGRVLEVLTQLSQAEDQGPQTLLCAELVSKTFVQLPSAVRGTVLLATYRDTQWSGLPHLSDTDQALTVAFNKLSATTVHKNLQDILPLALHDLLTFTGHAVNTAIGSEGQTSVVVKVLELMPEAMGSVHPLRHPHRSLLCHCLQRVLHCRLLDAREQKNCLNLVSLLVKQPTPTPDVTQHAPLLSPAEFLSSSVLPFITLHHASPEPPPISTEFALRLLIGCLEATRSEGRSDWLEGVHPAVVLACLAGVLQECGGMVGEDREVERAVTTKGLVLRVVREMAEHFTLAGMALEGERLGWLQDRCAQCHWMVCAYLSPFLGPADRTQPDMLIAGYVTGALKAAPQNPSALLRLSAVSDDAASQVVQALHSDVHIPRPSVLVSLAQVLPQILVTEVHRVVRVLTALVDTGCVRMDLHKHSLFDHSAFDISAECRREVMVCQLVTEAVVVMVCQEPGFSPPLLHHLAQLMVAALQTLIQPPPKGSKVADRCVLKVALFCQVCAVMSVGAEVMLDPLFVLLLDLLSSLLPHQDPQDPQSQEALSVPEENLRSSLMQGVALIPKKNLRNTLCKKLNCLQKKNSAEENQQATS